MSTISAAAVNELRKRTNQPMMDCKRALTEASGDMEKAVEILRKRGKDVADKKVGRETAEGRVAAFVDQGKKVGALVEVLCESAPVAKSDLFIQLANDLARQVALEGASTAETLLAQKFIDDPSKTVGDRVSEVIGLIRENMKPARISRLTGLLGSYCHHDGSVGVLLQVEGKDTAEPQVLRDVCMHITAVNPVAARREDVPKDVIEREMEVARGQAEATGKGKPANIIEKIAEGKLKTWFAEKVLVEQPFVKDPSKTVGDLLKSAGLQVVKFVRYKIGEAS
jgi:elongation factor Ts